MEENKGKDECMERPVGFPGGPNRGRSQGPERSERTDDVSRAQVGENYKEKW